MCLQEHVLGVMRQALLCSLQVFTMLKDLSASLAKLQGVVRRVDRDVSVLSQESSGQPSDMAIEPSYA